MTWLETFKEERLRKKIEDQESVDFYEEVIRRYYMGPDSN